MIVENSIIEIKSRQRRNKCFNLLADMQSLKRFEETIKEISTLYFNIDKKALGYIICAYEVFSNCVKHAYKDIPGKVNVKLILKDDYLITKIRDYGMGIPYKYVREIPRITDEKVLDFYGRGLLIVNNLSSKLFIKRHSCGGTEVVFYFKRT